MGVREQKETAVLNIADQDDPSQDPNHHPPLKLPMTSASPPLLVATPPPSSSSSVPVPATAHTPSAGCSSSSCSPISTSAEEESPLLGGSSSNASSSCSKQQACSKEEMELLARLELQNRLLEADAKSLNSLTSGHSRKSSSTSLVSVNSSASQAIDEDGEDVWQVWGTVVSEWETYSKKRSAFVKDLVRRGIPHHFRSIVWQLLCGAQSCPARELYTDYLKSTSPCEKVILRDIARTYPEHDFFREKDGPGQESLFNVMKAYSLHDREVGYCQGSAFIVGLLLLQMPEEDAFSVMVRLMEDYRLREMYKPSMAELGLCMYQLECIVQEQIPEIYMHFQAQSFHTSMYASSWFLTLFTSSLPLPLACRVMDLFLSEGMEIIFRIGLAILQYCKEDLLQYDMEGMLRYFQKEMPAKCEADPDYLISLAMQVKYNCKKMKKLEKDYTSYKAKEQEDMVELRRLRTENKLLRQRIEHLELESSSLADRLIQDQVTRAQEAENNYAVNRELSSLKQQELLTRQELERAYHRIKELHEANSQNEEIIKSLQEELIAVKLTKAEARDTMQDLLQRIQDLETVNKCLKDNYTDVTMIRIQEELISVKLREAEAQQYIKELLEKVSELEEQVDTVKGKFGMNNFLRLRPNFITQRSESDKDASATISSLEQKVKDAEKKRFEMELEHEKEVSELKNKVSVLESQNSELTKSNQLKLAAENEDLKILCKRVTELQVKLAEERDLNKKLSAALENNKEGDANHNTEGNYAHIGNFLEALRQSRSNILSDEGNFEQIYKLRLNTKDVESSVKMETVKEN